MELNLMVRPILGLEFQDESEFEASTPDHGGLSPKHSTVREGDSTDHSEGRRRCWNLKMKIPSYNIREVAEKEDESNEGLKTPTSSDQKIPEILQCPPAPRKPKSSPSRKRKPCPSSSSPFPVLDLSIAFDIRGMIKKVKRESHTQSDSPICNHL